MAGEEGTPAAGESARRTSLERTSHVMCGEARLCPQEGRARLSSKPAAKGGMAACVARRAPVGCHRADDSRARRPVLRGGGDEPVELVEEALEVGHALGARVEQRVHDLRGDAGRCAERGGEMSRRAASARPESAARPAAPPAAANRARPPAGAPSRHLPVSPRISPHLPVSAQRRVVAAYGGDPPPHTQAWRVRLLCP